MCQTKRVRLRVLILLVLILPAVAQHGTPAPPVADARAKLAPATLNNGLLEQSQLGLVLPLPAGMSARQRVAPTALDVTMTDTGSGAEVAVVALALRDYPQVTSFDLDRDRDQQHEFSPAGPVSELEINGLRFYRRDYRGNRVFQTRLYAWTTGWRLAVFLSTPQPERLPELLHKVQGLRFAPAWLPPPKDGVRVRLSSGISQRSLRQKVLPDYPREALYKRIHGDVLLTAVIGSDGKVLELRPKGGPPELLPAAMAAVRQWEYEPYRLKGEPVEVETQVRVRFSIQ